MNREKVIQIIELYINIGFNGIDVKLKDNNKIVIDVDKNEIIFRFEFMEINNINNEMLNVKISYDLIEEITL